jgi:hypothetical protein
VCAREPARYSAVDEAFVIRFVPLAENGAMGSVFDGSGSPGCLIIIAREGGGGVAAELLSVRFLCLQYWCPTGHLAFHEHL